MHVVLWPDRSKSGSRTGDPSSRNFTKMARFPWSTVRTPATPWPATLLHHRLFGTIARTRARSTGARSPSHLSVLHPPTWKITVITGIRRGHIYSIQCTTRDHHRAWGPCINRHWWKSGKKTIQTPQKYAERDSGSTWSETAHLCCNFIDSLTHVERVSVDKLC